MWDDVQVTAVGQSPAGAGPTAVRETIRVTEVSFVEKGRGEAAVPV